MEIARRDKTRRAFINAQIVDPSQNLNENGGICFEDGRIVAIGKKVTPQTVGAGTKIIDCKGKSLFPGLVDMCVYTGEPGTEYRETLATASQAAAAGGVTTMIVMPNTTPVIDDAAIVDYVLRRARDTASVRVAPMASITKGLEGTAMTEYGLLKEAGAVAITDGLHGVKDASLLRTAMSYANTFDMLVVQHVEEKSLANGVMNAGERATRLGLSGIPALAETIMLERDLRLVEMTGARYHASQISCSASLDVMRRAKANGLPVSCGVSVNHLTLNENDIGAYRTFFKLSPPLRGEDERRALVEGVEDGTIDIIVSGHNPQSADTKRLPFAEAAFGAIGLETLFSAALSLVHSGDLSLKRLIESVSCTPAAILDLEAGSLSPGRPADFIIANLETSWMVEDEKLHSISKNSPFEHRSLEGRICETVVAGRSVFSYDQTL